MYIDSLIIYFFYRAGVNILREFGYGNKRKRLIILMKNICML